MRAGGSGARACPPVFCEMGPDLAMWFVIWRLRSESLLVVVCLK